MKDKNLEKEIKELKNEVEAIKRSLFMTGSLLALFNEIKENSKKEKKENETNNSN